MSGLLRFIYSNLECANSPKSVSEHTADNIETMSLFFNCLYNKVVGANTLRETSIIFANKSSVFLLGDENTNDGSRTTIISQRFNTESLNVSNFMVSIGINRGNPQELKVATTVDGSSSNHVTFRTHTGQVLDVYLGIMRMAGSSNEYRSILRVDAPMHSSAIEAVSFDMTVFEERTMDALSMNVNAMTGRGASVNFRSFLIVENVGGVVATIVKGMSELIGNENEAWPRYEDYHWIMRNAQYDMNYRATNLKNINRNGVDGAVDRESVEVAFKLNMRNFVKCALWNPPKWDTEVVEQLSMYNDREYTGPTVHVEQFKVKDLLNSYSEYTKNAAMYSREERQRRIDSNTALEIDANDRAYEIINDLNNFYTTYGEDSLSWIFLEEFENNRLAKLCKNGFVKDFLDIQKKLAEIEVRAAEEPADNNSESAYLDDHITDDGATSIAQSIDGVDESNKPSFDRPSKSSYSFNFTTLLAYGTYDIFSPIVKIRINRLNPRGRHYALKYVSNDNNFAPRERIAKNISDAVCEYSPYPVTCTTDGKGAFYIYIEDDKHTIYDLFLIRHFVRHFKVCLNNVNSGKTPFVFLKFDFDVQFVKKDVRQRMNIYDDLELLSSWGDREAYGTVAAEYVGYIRTLTTVGRLIVKGVSYHFNVARSAMTYDHRQNFINSMNSTNSYLTTVPCTVKYDMYCNEETNKVAENLLEKIPDRSLQSLVKQITPEEFEKIDIDYIMSHHFIPRLTKYMNVEDCEHSFASYIKQLQRGLNDLINDMDFFHRVLPYFTFTPIENENQAVFENGMLRQVNKSKIRTKTQGSRQNLEMVAKLGEEGGIDRMMKSEKVMYNGHDRYTAFKIPQTHYKLYAQYVYLTQHMAICFREILVFLAQSSTSKLCTEEFIKYVSSESKRTVDMRTDDLPMNLESIVWFKTILQDNHDMSHQGTVILSKIITCLETVFHMAECWYISKLIDNVRNNLQNNRVDFVRTFIVTKTELTRACFDNVFNMPRLRASANARVVNLVSRLTPLYRRQQESNIRQYQEFLENFGNSPYEYVSPSKFFGLPLGNDIQKAFCDIFTQSAVISPDVSVYRAIQQVVPSFNENDLVVKYVKACRENPLLYQISPENMARFRFFLMNDPRISKVVYEGRLYHVSNVGLGIPTLHYNIPNVNQGAIVENIIVTASDIVNYINLHMIANIKGKIVKAVRPYFNVMPFVEKVISSRYSMTVKNVSLDASRVGQVKVVVTDKNLGLFMHLNPTVKNQEISVAVVKTSLEEQIKNTIDCLIEFQEKKLNVLPTNVYLRLSHLEEELSKKVDLSVDEKHFLAMTKLYHEYVSTQRAVRTIQESIVSFLTAARRPDINLNTFKQSIDTRFTEFCRMFSSKSIGQLDTEVAELLACVIADLKNNGYITYNRMRNEFPHLENDDIRKIVTRTNLRLKLEADYGKQVLSPVNDSTKNQLVEVFKSICRTSPDMAKAVMIFMARHFPGKISSKNTISRYINTIHDSLVKSCQDTTYVKTGGDESALLDNLSAHCKSFLVETEENGTIVMEDTFESEEEPNTMYAKVTVNMPHDPSMDEKTAHEKSITKANDELAERISHYKKKGGYEKWYRENVDVHRSKFAVKNGLIVYANKETLNFFTPSIYIGRVTEMEQTETVSTVLIKTETTNELIVANNSPNGKVYATTLYELYMLRMQDFIKMCEKEKFDADKAMAKYQATCTFYLYEVMQYAQACNHFREQLMDYVYNCILNHNLVSFMPNVPVYYVETEHSKCKLRLYGKNYVIADITHDCPAFIKMYLELENFALQRHTQSSIPPYTAFDHNLFQNDGRLWIRNPYRSNPRAITEENIADFVPKVFEIDFGYHYASNIQANVRNADFLALNVVGIHEHASLTRTIVKNVMNLVENPKVVRPVSGPVNGIYITALYRLMTEKLAYEEFLNAEHKTNEQAPTLIDRFEPMDTRDLGDIVINSTSEVRDTIYGMDQNAFLQPATDNIDEMFADEECEFIVLKDPSYDITYVYPIPEHDGVIPTIQPYFCTDGFIRKNVIWNDSGDERLIEVPITRESKCFKQLQYYMKVYFQNIINGKNIQVGEYEKFIGPYSLPEVRIADIDTLRLKIGNMHYDTEQLTTSADSLEQMKVDLYNMIFTSLRDYPDSFENAMKRMRALEEIDVATILSNADDSILYDIMSKTFGQRVKNINEMMANVRESNVSHNAWVCTIALFRPQVIAYIVRQNRPN